MNIPKVSVIIPTLGRKKELDELLKSLEISDYKNFDVIIVDQNENGFLTDIISKYREKYNITHIVIKEKCASIARNTGARISESEIICFPDDDSRLFPNTISEAINIINEKNVDVVFGKSIDEEGKDSVISFSKQACFLTTQEHEGMFIEFTMFVKRKKFLEHLYDETFGVGAFYGAEEGYDLVLRMLKNMEQIYYSPLIKFYE
jgi:glycosyltransferase involved in cell wall biosynthesis